MTEIVLKDIFGEWGTMSFTDDEIASIQNYWSRQEAGIAGVIQKELPHLSPDQREFLMTGLTPEKWNEVFGEEE